MEQLELFDKETIQDKANKRKPIAIDKKKTDRCHVEIQASLMYQLQPEIKKIPLMVCKQPKTIKMIPYNWSKEKKEAYIKAHFDENGKFIMNPDGDFEIFGGAANRQ